MPRRYGGPVSPTPARPPTPARVWPLYAGGFLGPFGGAMVNTMLPELADGLDTSLAQASTSLTAYMLPFAGLMVVSGTLAAAWGPARTVRRAYGVYALASLICVAAGSAPLFLTGRVVQGTANAFTTPLLIAMIARLVPADRLGRALGTYASLQAAGQAFAPLVGGFAAGVDYRWAFVATALAALVLGVLSLPGRDGRVPDPDEQPADGAPPGRGAKWRALANRRLARACVIAWCCQFTSTGLMLLAALSASDRFGLSPGARGLLVAGFGVAGLVSGHAFGWLVDRIGIRRMGTLTLLLLGAAVATAGTAPRVTLLFALVALAGVASTGGRVLINSLALASTPANTGGATSDMLSA